MANYSPAWAPHVVGTFEKKVDDQGVPEKIMVAVACATCGEQRSVPCYSGAPRTKVLAFALSHVHADPMAVAERAKKQ